MSPRDARAELLAVLTVAASALDEDGLLRLIDAAARLLQGARLRP